MKLGGHLNMEKWLGDRGVKYSKKVKQDVVYYELDNCPFNPNHRKPDSAFTLQTATGRPGFRCFHQSCSEHNWQTASAKIGKPQAAHFSNPIAGSGFAPTSDRDRGIQEFEITPSSDFFSQTFTLEYLVSDLIVTGQNLIVGGPEKCLKTNIAVDLMLSIGSGAPFLHHFRTPEGGKPCALFTGESGARAIQDVGKRVARSRGIDPGQTKCLWSFALPRLADRCHLRGIEKLIRDNGLALLLVDPAYLCMLANSDVQASDIMKMGPLLNEFGSVAGDTNCVMGLIHHFKKRNKDTLYARPGLEDLSHSGFSAFARQWLLLNKRGPFRREFGLHELFVCSGGSAGHGGDYVLDVDEGDPNDWIEGRRWLPSLSSLSEWEADREAGAAATQATDSRQAEQRVLSAVNSADRAVSLTAIATRSGISDGKLVKRIVSDLVDAGALVSQVHGSHTVYTVPGHPAQKLKK